ncbi:MAG: NUDIX domain-containing protein [Candidatus Krumholzibacteriia bacterium]
MAPDPQPRPRAPALTVDAVVLSRGGEGLLDDGYRVLLVERGREPFRGRWALPGGFVDYGEDPDLAVGREVAEETGLEGLPFRQFRAFGQPGRDPRGHTVSIVYVAFIIGDRPAVTGGDDAAAAAWHPLDGLPDLAFDHGTIVARVIDNLKLR